MPNQPNNQHAGDEKVTLTMTRNEAFQLHLCIVARLSSVQTKFVNAYCPEEQAAAQSLMGYLTELSGKISEVLRNGGEN